MKPIDYFLIGVILGLFFIAGVAQCIKTDEANNPAPAAAYRSEQ